MTVEEFYQSIRSDADPVNFKDAKAQLDDNVYASLEHKMDPATRFYVKKFLDDNPWKFIFFPKTWLDHRGIYWMIFIISFIQSVWFYFSFGDIILPCFSEIYVPYALSLKVWIGFIIIGYFLPSIICSLILSPFIQSIYVWNIQRRIQQERKLKNEYPSVTISVFITMVTFFIVPFFLTFFLGKVVPLLTNIKKFLLFS